MDAFTSDTPSLFHTGGPFSPLAKHDSSYDQLKTYGDWHNASATGVGDTIKDMIPQVEKAISNYISEQYQFGSPLHTFATHCLKNTTAWLIDFIKWIGDNQESFSSSQFDIKTSWALNTKLARRIFSDLGAVRTGVRHSFRIGDCRAIGLQCLWGVLKTHKVMDDYRGYQFKNHPSMSSEHVKFMATNMGLESVARLEVRVIQLEKEAKTREISVKEACNSGKTSSNKATANEKEISSILKRLKRMEDGGR